MSYARYTEYKLQTIYRSFGHQSVRETEGLRQRASAGSISKEVRDTNTSIAQECGPFKPHLGAPRRFKLTVVTHSLYFTHSVKCDTMFLIGQPVLHIIGMGTVLCASSFLRSQSGKEIYSMIASVRLLVYIGAPDDVLAEKGSSYVSPEMRSNLEATWVNLPEIAVENPGSTGSVERYVENLLAAFLKILAELGRGTSDKHCIQLSVHDVKVTIGPEGFCELLLVFGVLLRPARKAPSLTQMERARTVEQAMITAGNERVMCGIDLDIKQIRGTKGLESSSLLPDLMEGRKFSVWGSKPKVWDGPYKFISM